MVSSRFAARIVLLATTAAGFIILPGSAFGRPGRAPIRRYVSAQAYHHALRAELALTRQDWDIAHDELQLALVYDPSSVHLHAKLIRLTLAQGHLTRARKYVRRARLMAGEGADVLRIVSAVARAEGRLPHAEKVLRQARRKSPRDLDVLLALAEVVAARGRQASALTMLSQAADRHPQDVRPLVLSARWRWDQGRWTDVVALIERARRRAPLDADAVALIADAYERTRRSENAQAVWTQYAAQHPYDTRSRLELARLALSTERDAVAERWLAEVRAQDPDADVGPVYLAAGADVRAVAEMKARLQAGFDSDALRWGLGRALARLGRDDEALKQWRRVSADAPFYGQMRARMAQVMMRHGRLDRAASVVQGALRSGVEPRGALIEIFTDIEVRAGRPESALRFIVAVRSKHPLDVDLWVAELRLRRALAQPATALRAAASTALSDAGRYRLETEHLLATEGQQAPGLRDAVRAWCRAAPRDVDALLLAAEVDPEPSSAREWAERALSERPADPRTLAAYGNTVARDGDQRAGLEHLRRSVRLDPWKGRVAEQWGDLAAQAGRLSEARRAYDMALRAFKADVRARKPGAKAQLERSRRKRAAMRTR